MMQLDLTRPMLVITGAWNPAVFTPQWVAKNLFDIPEGREVTVNIAQNVDPNGNVSAATYFGDIGMSVGNRRLDLFSNSFEDTGKRALERLCLKIIDLLPHTPIDGFGVNFIFRTTDPWSGLVDKLKTKDDIESEYEIDRQIFISVIKREKATLNFRREVAGAEIRLDLNFHHIVTNDNTVASLLPNCLDVLFDEGKGIIEELYGSFECEPKGHIFPEQSARSK
jgi:hypothetical protein